MLKKSNLKPVINLIHLMVLGICLITRAITKATFSLVDYKGKIGIYKAKNQAKYLGEPAVE